MRRKKESARLEILREALGSEFEDSAVVGTEDVLTMSEKYSVGKKKVKQRYGGSEEVISFVFSHG